MASVSPRSTWNDRLRTASTVRSDVAKRTPRPSTCTTRLSGSARLLARSTILLHPLLRSEEHTSELQSLMRISYAVFCLKKKNQQLDNYHPQHKNHKIN